MEESILKSIKKMLGILDDDGSFDVDVIIHINTVFSILDQLGAGPPEGFSISDSSATWYDFIPDMKTVEMIKSYVYLKVKLIFDPSLTSSITESMKELIKELEVRILFAASEMSRKEKIQNDL